MDEKTKKGIDKTVEIRYNNGRARRGVAQFGRVLGLGPRCRRFKSCRLDQKNLVKLLTMDQKPAIINRLSPQYAGVAQLVEQLICNQQVGGSSPSTSSTKLTQQFHMGEFPSGQRGQTVNLLSVTSVVRIHPRPPKILDAIVSGIFSFL